ncbi:RNA-directed DNA polymerase [Bremerella sp. T1]|uniref:RNA-directed DNA polymerase n=1 Tax=Bremerella sp. TYQ1 TaxID=3119568 RepID=UPI001CCE9063|nr:RNA-directed DNA polymerase [Bremerella volcania]UBM35326.1 RNA-directed DNA polymerase [Bremerella volcania]
MPQYNDYSEIQPNNRFLVDHAVLVQAWKKAHSYIRSHNWYADSLELDLSTIKLQSLITEWAEQLNAKSIGAFSPEPMRLVPAPKSTEWTTANGWNPKKLNDLRLRPLAHISIRDQALAMAVLICLANVVETAQGDPRLTVNLSNQKRVVSYGHRLVTRWSGDEASFQWGNAKLYRQYFEDYQQFVRRPEIIRQELFSSSNNWAIVQADLSQFYDLIPRSKLLLKLESLCNKHIPSHRVPHRSFFKVVERIFDWRWDDSDTEMAKDICKNRDGHGLPQGLAASGFFANAYLLDFDDYMVRLFGKRLRNRNWRIVDYCRYVDDMRFVIQFDEEPPANFESEFEAMMARQLNKRAPGLVLNKKKTQVMYGDSHSSNVPVADAMQAVNTNVSGPLDVETARHALEMLDGLLAVSNSRKNQPDPVGTGSDELLKRVLAVEPDVRNDTLERFVAHRWRRVYRTLRVMADDESVSDSTLQIGRRILDQRARAFAVELLRKWIADPSNVRLLRVSLDLFPDPEHLQIVLSLLSLRRSNSESNDKERLTADYIASELLRAGATETGFVRDKDELPGGANIEVYRNCLREFAESVVADADSSPWYLRQQALLFLAVVQSPISDAHDATKENRDYAYVHDLLQGKWPRKTPSRRESSEVVVPLCVISYRVSGGSKIVPKVLAKWINRTNNSVVQEQLRYIVEHDELFVTTMASLNPAKRELWNYRASTAGYISNPDLPEWKATEDDHTSYRLVEVMTSNDNPFQQETAAIRLLHKLSIEWEHARTLLGGVLTPSRIQVRCSSWKRLADPGDSLADIEFSLSVTPESKFVDERFRCPSWCRTRERWKYEVGQVVRATVIGKTDFTQMMTHGPIVKGITRYKGISTGWFKRKHGLFNDRQGLGHRLMPVSPWLSELIGRLLEWPGSRQKRELVQLPDDFTRASLGRILDRRLQELDLLYCRLSSLPLYPFPVPPVTENGRNGQLRVALVQTAFPNSQQFEDSDPTLDHPPTRRKHRRHLSAMLRLFMKLTEVREGYKDKAEPIDLVLFPELSVHPDDIFLLERFADSLKCLVFCGLVFHSRPDDESKLINSGLWIVPVNTGDGRSIRLIEQGKHHLTPSELELGITSYRPCQWLIEYGHSSKSSYKLSSSICFDATDLRLAADLKEHTDAYVVSALNKDIGTFDAMVTALHYHMFQHVLLVNSAEFGGSTAQAPYKDHFRKVIMHHHGADQATVSIFTIDLERFRDESAKSIPEIKSPPAGHAR